MAGLPSSAPRMPALRVQQHRLVRAEHGRRGELSGLHGRCRVLHVEHDDPEPRDRLHQGVLGEEQRRVVERADVTGGVDVPLHLEAAGGALVGRPAWCCSGSPAGSDPSCSPTTGTRPSIAVSFSAPGPQVGAASAAGKGRGGGPHRQAPGPRRRPPRPASRERRTWCSALADLVRHGLVGDGAARAHDRTNDAVPADGRVQAQPRIFSRRATASSNPAPARPSRRRPDAPRSSGRRSGRPASR